MADAKRARETVNAIRQFTSLKRRSQKRQEKCFDCKERIYWKNVKGKHSYICNLAYDRLVADKKKGIAVDFDLMCKMSKDRFPLPIPRMTYKKKRNKKRERKRK